MQPNNPDQNQDGKKLKLPPFVKDRIFIIAAGLILFIAVAGGVYSIFLLGGSAADEPAAAEQEEGNLDDDGPETAEVLPQQRRENDGGADEDGAVAGDDDVRVTFDPAIDPFTDPMRLTGTASGGRGGNMAIIESSGTSYIVAENDYVDDLWSVRDIRPDQVILRAHDKEVTLYLDRPPETRSLIPDRDEDDQGEGE